MAKYPRTYHLPWSPGATRDDRVQTDLSHIIGKNIIISEKLDGSNVCLSSNGVYARSHSGPPAHASFDMLKARHASLQGIGPIAGDPFGIEIFAEWCYAKHAIHYQELPDYLLVFGIRDPNDNRWYSWKSVVHECDNLDLTTAPVLYSGTARSETQLKIIVEGLAKEPSVYGGDREGVVLRVADSFNDEQFNTHVLKYVRKDHVLEGDEHWKHKEIIQNKLKTQQ